MKPFLIATMLAALTTALAGPLVFRKPVLRWDDPNPVGTIQHYRVWNVTWTNQAILATVTTNRWEVQLPSGQHDLVVTAVGTNQLESEASETLTIANVLAVLHLRIEQ